ncbi:MAG: formate dehydrogenase accessory sulfurtransferase FdhD [Deltaproteobacteria bacterium]|nr:MAG: formate dehydrogenase accessory sulfurtransferase FdhD [Deltaproteobacteria bacterium]
MSGRKQTMTFETAGAAGGGAGRFEFLREEPLMITIEDKPYAVLMRTPGEERELAVGFCLAEGVIDSAADIKTIGHDPALDENVVHVWLQAERVKRAKRILVRRGFISRTSCGVCGKELLEDLLQDLKPVEKDVRITPEKALACLARLEQHQQLYESTRCAHAALVFDAGGNLLGFAEDVGRHNAFDKAIGKALLAGRLGRAAVAVLSSRNSYELVQKAVRAGIPIVLSYSRPTAMAVELGRSMNLTLAFSSGGDLVVASGAERLAGSKG